MLRRLVSFFILLSAVCSSALASTDQWIEVRSDHFTVVTDSNEKQARHIVDQFERMRWVFEKLFPKANADPVSPIVVLAARNGKGFQAMEPEAYLAAGQLKLAGLFLKTQDKNYVLMRLDAEFEHPFATIYHEYTHLQFSGDAEWLPLWLNEGLAEFMQNTDIQDKDVKLGQSSIEDILYLRQNRLIPLGELFKVDFKSPYYHEEQKGSVFYAESWALVHYLMFTDHGKSTHRLDDYMTLLRHREDPALAAQKAFGDLKQLQGALESYIHESSYKYYILSSAAAPIDESSYKVRALTRFEADADRADILANVQRFKDARDLLDAVLKADPNNSQAHETMAFLEMREGRMDEARKLYADAVKMDSQNYLAHYYFASMSMRENDEEKNKEIEASLRSAIRLNPRFAPAYDLLASFYARQHQNLDEAHTLSLQAIQLEPGNFGFRMNAANLLMTMERYSDAVDALRTTQKLVGNPSQAEILKSRIAEIEEYQTLRAHASSNDSGVVDIVPPGAGNSGQAGSQVVEIVAVDQGPAHPTEPATGAKHEAMGVIRGVKCSYPSVIEFRVEGPKKTVSLYNNNYYKLELSALGFTPPADLNPCHQIEGMKARVEYVESTDKSVDGQLTAVELRK